MNPLHDTDTDRPTDPRLARRRFLALGASAGLAAIAGCTGDSSSDPTVGGGSTTDGSDGADADVGNFRLLISDQPVAIDEFDSLDVSLSHARVFRGEGSDDDGDEEETDTDTETETETETETPTPTPEAATETDTETDTETETEEPEDDDGEGQDGFTVIQLDGVTVDLTEVVGDKALEVFDGDLPAGRYSKIELHATGVEGIVDGGTVDVKIPSGKLQIVKPFEVVAGETLSFVFDITVVRKGTGGYNLLPVISESGVAGKDVEVEEVGDRPDDDEEETEEPDETEPEDGEDEGQGPPDDAGEQGGQ